VHFESVEGFVNRGAVIAGTYLRDGALAFQQIAPDPGGGGGLISYFSVQDPNYTVPDTPLDGFENDNTMSAAPGILAAAFDSDHLSVHAGTQVNVTLSLSNGVGNYKYSVVHGHLPPGLRLRHHHLKGTPKEPGKSHVIIRALNQYGGAAFVHLTVVVHHS
jgi:hypothetical protein